MVQRIDTLQLVCELIFIKFGCCGPFPVRINPPFSFYRRHNNEVAIFVGLVQCRREYFSQSFMFSVPFLVFLNIVFKLFIIKCTQ